jgi:hypothetical protein
MDLEDLAPADAVALDAATLDAFFVVLREFLDDGLDVHLQVLRRPPVYVVLVLGVQGELVVVEHELRIDWAGLDERHRLRVLRLYLDELAAGHEMWRRQANRKLVALGLTPIEPT